MWIKTAFVWRIASTEIKTINIHSIIRFAEICPGMFPQIFFIYIEKLILG